MRSPSFKNDMDIVDVVDHILARIHGGQELASTGRFLSAPNGLLGVQQRFETGPDVLFGISSTSLSPLCH